MLGRVLVIFFLAHHLFAPAYFETLCSSWIKVDDILILSNLRESPIPKKFEKKPMVNKSDSLDKVRLCPPS